MDTFVTSGELDIKIRYNCPGRFLGFVFYVKCTDYFIKK